MATVNPFDLLGDDDNDDVSALLAAQQHKVAAAVAATSKKSAPFATQPAKASAKLPTKPLPPAQAVKEAREGGRGGRGGGRGYGRSRGGYGNSENSYGNDSGATRSYDDRERRPFSGPRGGGCGGGGGFRGGRRGGFSNGEEAGDGERPRRAYDRHSGTGRSNDFKREGSGRGNWGATTDEIAQETNEAVVENDANVAAEKPANEDEKPDAAKENPANETEEKDPEEQQMTLEEYEKVLEEKRKALQAMKVEERKVDTKEFESMQMIAKKKSEEDIVFIKLGSDKDKRKEAAEKEERAKKSLSINEFLKPAEGESFYRSGGRGRGRGRGGPRGGGGGYGGRSYGDAPAPAIADPGQFPSLGGK